MSAPQTPEGAATPARILVVDDEPRQMKATCDMLRDRGHDVVGFTSPREALARLVDERFALLVADLRMVEMDGISLLRAALQLDPELAALIVTGEGTIASAVEAMQLGALDYVIKPFKLSVLLTAISRALALRDLRIQNAHLQHSIRQRTVELEAANRELEAFSYTISHDLRAPLRAILGFSGILGEEFSGAWPPEAKRLLERISFNAARMAQLIEDLLRFARLSRQSLNVQPLRVQAMVGELLEELRAEQTDRSVDVALGALPDCTGDGSLVRQVFQNLLSNAFKYTRQRDPALIEIGCETHEGEPVYFVRDNGAGFDMNQAHRLFGVFSRLHDDAEFEGTGIGLSIVQRIVQRHGGRIWAEAEPEKGACFRFTLPASSA